MLRDGSFEGSGQWGAEDGEGGGIRAAKRRRVQVADDSRCEQIHQRLKRIAKARGALDLEEAAALREADAACIWRRYGCASLLEYMERELGYTPRVALERLRVAKVIVDLPQIRDAMLQGELSFSAVRELTRVATAETEREWLAACAEMNQRELEERVSGHKRGDRPTDRPDPALRWKDLRLKVRPETEALMRQAQQILSKERGERLDEDAYQAATARMIIDGSRPATLASAAVPTPRASAASSSPRSSAASSTPRQSATSARSPASAASAASSPSTISPASAASAASTASAPASSVSAAASSASVASSTSPKCSISEESTFAETKTNEQAVASEVDESGEAVPCRTRAPYQIAVTVCRECKRGWQHGGGITVEMSPAAIERAWCDAEEIGSIDGAGPERAKQAIPPSVRRLVWARDHGRCRVQGCRSSTNLDVHHIVHREDGGTNDLYNLLLLCEGHHLAHHEGNLVITGTASDLTISRRASNSFTAATRFVETAKALKALGYSKSEAKEAAEQTRTHVGTVDWPIEAWIKYALSKCSRG